MPTTLTPPVLYITPSRPKVAPTGTVQFSSVGGSGTGYAYALPVNRSGGSITAGGLYTAGSLANVIDQVQVTDSYGNQTTRDIEVSPGNQLSALRLSCQQRTDMVNSNFITTSEWNSYINTSYFELYDLLIGAYGNDYNVADPFFFTTDGITERYPLPVDFYKLLGVDVQISNTAGGYLKIPKFNFGDRDKFLTPYQIFYGIRTNLHYRLFGDRLWIIPIAAGGQIIRVLFVPRMTKLVQDTDVLDGVSGWEEYVIADVCIKALTKRESDATVFVQQKAMMEQRIQGIADDRDAGAPATVVDTRSQDEDSMTGRSGGWGGPF